MNHRDIAVLMDGIAPVLRGYVQEAFKPIGTRLDAIERRFSDLPAPRDVDPVLILRLVEETVAKNPAPAGRDGKDADPELVAELVDKAVAALEPAKDGAPGPAGESVTVEQLAPLVVETVAKAVSDEIDKITLPVGKDGAPGQDGAPGESVTIEMLAPMVLEEVSKAVSSEIEKIAADLPAGKDGAPGEPGKSVTVEELTPVIDEIVVRRVAEIPPAKDGVDGKEGAPGRDGRDGLPGVQGEKGLDGRNGADGKDGVGIDDFDVSSVDDGRSLEFSLKRDGGDPIVKRVSTGAVLDRGVWREKAYEKGDGVTWGGSLFIAQRQTTPNEKPGEVPEAFRLAVKRGRDGKEGKPGPAGERGQKGDPGTPGRNSV